MRLLPTVLDPRAAPSRADVKKASELLRAGALDVDVDSVRLDFLLDVREYSTLLQLAASCLMSQMIEVLLQLGARPDQRGILDAPRRCHRGDSPLINVVQAPRAYSRRAGGSLPEECARLLLAAGANPNAVAGNHVPALHFATYDDESLDLVRILVDAGADPLAVNAVGESPIDNARRFGSPEMVALLREAAAPRLAGLKRKSLATMRRKKRVDVESARGVMDLAESFASLDYEYSFAMVDAPVEAVARELADRWRAPRLEAEAHQRLVKDADAYTAVLALRSNPWTLVLPSDTGFSREVEEAAKWLSETLATRAMSCRFHLATEYREGELVASAGDYDDEWSLYRVRRNVSEVSEWLGERGVFVPKIHVGGNGYWAEVLVCGLRKADLGRLDIVVQAEIAEPDDEG